jgi:tetratricopeptide (TPR) repeat protein
MRAVLASAVVVAALVFTDTAFAGSQKDRDDCARKGDLDRRIAGCSRLIEDRSESQRDRAGYYNNRSGAWRLKRDFDRAIADGTQAIRLDPKLAAARYSRGAAWRDKGNFDRAIADFTEALRINPQFVEALVGRGVSWSAQGDPDRAIADLSEAIRLNPKVVNAYLGRGIAWHRKGDFGRAIGDYNQAIRLDPNNAARHTNRGSAYSSRGLAYFNEGDFSAAAADLLPSIESKDAAYQMLFRYLARTRAGEAATAELETNAARLKNKEWPFAAIELYLGRRSPEATLDAANNADSRCEAQFYIGEWHLLQGDQTNAKSALQIAVDTCRKDFVEYFAAIAELKRMTP